MNIRAIECLQKRKEIRYKKRILYNDCRIKISEPSLTWRVALALSARGYKWSDQRKIMDTDIALNTFSNIVNIVIEPTIKEAWYCVKCPKRYGTILCRTCSELPTVHLDDIKNNRLLVFSNKGKAKCPECGSINTMCNKLVTKIMCYTCMTLTRIITKKSIPGGD